MRILSVSLFPIESIVRKARPLVSICVSGDKQVVGDIRAVSDNGRKTALLESARPDPQPDGNGMKRHGHYQERPELFAATAAP